MRLAFGEVKGYQENGKRVPPWTTIGGTYKHAGPTNKEPFQLPTNGSTERKLDLDNAVQLRQHGRHHRRQLGQSGDQPAGEVVGLIFDGNIQSLVLDFAYSDDQARRLGPFRLNCGGFAKNLRCRGAGGRVDGQEKMMPEFC